MSLVSIIIPNYNTGRYLPEALASVFAQTYPHYEIIIVDDGSTDETKQILAPYMERIRFIEQANAGVSAARNRGLREARGEWILFLDADDKLLPHKLERQLALGDAAILHSGWWLIAEDGTLLEEIKPYDNVPVLNLESWLFWKAVFPAAMLFRRVWLERVGGFDESLRHAEDVDLVLRISAAGGNALWLKEATAQYRQRANSASRKSLNQAESLERVLNKFFAMPDLPVRIHHREIHVRYYSLLWSVWQVLADSHEQTAKEYLLEAKRLINLPDAFLLLDWQQRCNAPELFAEILDLPYSTETILSGDYAALEPIQQAELSHYFVACRNVNLADFTAPLAPEAKLAAYLTAFIWSYGRKALWPVLLYSFQKNALAVYRFVLRSAYSYRYPKQR